VGVANVDFVTRVHTATTRNYLTRVVEDDKAACSEVALQWGKDYWDGDRRYGYGGFRYDGRWRGVAEQMVRHYGLRPGASILDVGCGKGFLLYEFTQVLRGAEVAGLDISEYAIAHAKEEVKAFLRVGTAAQLPFADRSFDLVVSINTLHNLYIYDLWSALKEIERVGCGARYVVVSEPNPYRRDLAARMGATVVVDPETSDLADVQRDLGMVEGFDVVLEMSGNPAAFKEMIESLKNGSRIALLGILPDETKIPWNQVIFKGLLIKGIYGREMYETWYKMCAMLQSGLDIQPILTHRFPVSRYEEGFEIMSAGKSGKIILDWPQ